MKQPACPHQPYQHRVARWPRLLLAAGLAALPPAGLGESSSDHARTSASIDFRIIIPSIMRVTSLTHPEHVVIDAQHVAQGYVDVDAATSARLTNNHRNGYQLSAHHDPRLLSGVEMQILDQPFAIRAAAGSIRVVAGRNDNQLVQISYRLLLADGVRPGQYRWPVALAFSVAAH